MKILVLSWRGLGHPNAGGAEIATFEHAKKWVQAGHIVTLFTAYYPNAKREEILAGVRIIRNGSQVFGVQFKAFKWYLFNDHPKYDVVIDQFHGIPFFTPLYVSSKKLGFIHEVTKELWRLNPWPKPLNLIPFIFGTFFEPAIFKFLYSNIPFMAVSESTKKDLIDWGIPSGNITVIHNGINIPKIKSHWLKERNKTLVYLGSISKDKGIEKALNVFAYLYKIQRDWKFWVVGKSDLRYLKILKKQVSNLGISKKIKFWGFVNEEKKYELLAKAHILINPSIREGWGLVVIEGARVGTPTIAFNVAGLRDSIINGKTGILIDKQSAEDLANKVMELLSNVKKYKQMSKDAILWSKRFSWEKSTKESINLLEKLVRDQGLQK